MTIHVCDEILQQVSRYVSAERFEIAEVAHATSARRVLHDLVVTADIHVEVFFLAMC